MNNSNFTTAESSTPVPIALRLLHIADALYIAKDLNGAVHMALHALKVDEERRALFALSGVIDSTLSDAVELIEDARRMCS